VGWRRIAFGSLAALTTVRVAVACATFTSDPAPAAGADGAPEDAAVEALPPPVLGEAGVDAGPEAAPPAGCPSGAFCDGFERAASALQGNWDEVITTGSVTIDLDHARAKGGMSSLHLFGTAGAAALRHDLKGGSPLHLAFYLFVKGPPQNDGANIAQFVFATQNAARSVVSVTLEAKGIKLTEQLLVADAGANGFRAGAPVTMPLDRWVRCIFDVLGTDASVILPDEVGKPRAALTLQLSHVIPKSVIVGLPYAGDEVDALDLFVDDVVAPP
jgi:hypothetical protein